LNYTRLLHIVCGPPPVDNATQPGPPLTNLLKHPDIALQWLRYTRCD